MAVATGPGGILEGMGPGKGYIDVSTVDVATSTRIAAAVRAVGGSFLEAPVSGSKVRFRGEYLPRGRLPGWWLIAPKFLWRNLIGPYV